MHLETIWLIVGLIGLWLGSELAINGAKNIAVHFRISAGFIGLTILSIGTSVPEIAVSIAGGIDRLAGLETSGIVIGNKIGSAANQLTIILGIIGLLGALTIRKKILFREGLMLVGSIVIIGLMGFDGNLSIFEGYVLMLIYLLYLIDLTRQEKLYTKIKGEPPKLHLALDALRLTGGLLLVGYAADFVVRNGISVASQFGVSQAFVGIFIIGLGTGLPELAISLAALKKNEMEMSVGNLIGSNICDLLFSLGIGAVFAGFIVTKEVLYYDLPALLIISLTVIYFFRTRFKLERKEAVILLALYAAYLGIRLWAFG